MLYSINRLLFARSFYRVSHVVVVFFDLFLQLLLELCNFRILFEGVNDFHDGLLDNTEKNFCQNLLGKTQCGARAWGGDLEYGWLDGLIIFAESLHSALTSLFFSFSRIFHSRGDGGHSISRYL